ncbi:MAG: zinc-ribbon domain-containing protein [Oscillospiraceae bacterium]|nr:zinc-ribbon domain-containing protein [Oscillospiraceae bacterium]
MGFLEKLGKATEKAGEKVAKAASGVADKSKILAEKTKLKSQVNSENSRINKTYAELGKKYFEISGENPAPEYQEFIVSIKDSMRHVAELQQQIAALDTDTTCPSCGATLKKDQQFCQACGARQENYVEVPAGDVEVINNCADQQTDSNGFDQKN